MNYPPVPCLDYATLRPQIQSGDILLCSGTAPFSRIIQSTTGSPWSHVALLCWDTQIDRLLVFESVESIGCWDIPVSRYVVDYKDTGCPYPGRIFIARHPGTATLTPAQWVTFKQAAKDRGGYVYDKQEIMRIAACLLSRNVHQEPPDIRDARKFICSEFAAVCLQAVGINIPWNPRGFIAPADFAADPAVTILWEVATT